ncbi:MAG: hypothetical protein ACI4MP_04945 [Candidatus Ventricola sp.]
MKRRLKAYALLLTLCAALLCSCAAAGAETAIRAWVGYDGAVLSGRWFPLFVEVTAGDVPVEGELMVDVGVGAGVLDRFVQPVSVPAGETRTYRLPVRPMVNQRTFEVQLGCGGSAVSATARAARAVSEDALVIGVLGEETSGLADALCAIEQRDVHGQREIIEAIALDAESFAQDAREMSAFDAMVVLDDAARTLDSASAGLLTSWQQSGGILMRRSSEDLSMLTPELAAQQVMSEIRAAQEAGQGVERESSNYPYSTALNGEMTADGSGSLLPAALVLTLYVLAAGLGAYGLMKRLDRSRMLWAVIPALAIAACGVMALLGAGLGLNRPMSSSVHLVRYDADGQTDVSELTQLTYAGLGRRVASTQGGVPLERMAYSYFSEYTNMEEKMELRNVITLGERPSIELEGNADWLVRSLVVKSDAAPAGSMTAFAHMEKDGLHVEVENNTDVTIENAVLITEIGYARLGDLAPGAAAQTVLMRTDEAPWNDEGQLVIREQEMLPFKESVYSVVWAAVDPEAVQDKTWQRSSLPREEQQRRQIMQCVLELGPSAARQKDFSCMLIGETPEIACETLLLDGNPVSRRAEKSVLVCTAAFEPVSPSGYFYYPEGTFRRLEASLDGNGVPVPGKEYESGYVYEKDEVLLGFSLDGVDAAGIEEIRLQTDGGMNGGNEQPAVFVEVYDYASGEWVRLEEDGDIRIDGALARRVVSRSGALCLRFTGEHLADWGVRLPNIVVEGQLSAQEEGGEAA